MMCHSYTWEGYFDTRMTAEKILQSDFYCPTIFKDAHRFYTECLKSQEPLNICKRDEMLLWLILDVEILIYGGLTY